MNKMDRRKSLAAMNKKSGDELQQFLAFKKRGFICENKKGKGSYSRKTKHKNTIMKG